MGLRAHERMNAMHAEAHAWKWLQQQLFREGLLSDEQILRCQSIPGWEWTGEPEPSPEVLSRVILNMVGDAN